MEQQVSTFYQSDKVQIRFNDIDLLGHVNNATIQEYFDLGRMYYIHDVFGDELFKGHFRLIIASINTDFLLPVFLREHIEVKTAIYHIGTKSLKMEQHLVDTKNHALKAVCQSVMVGFDKKSHQPIEIKDEWRALIAKKERW